MIFSPVSTPFSFLVAKELKTKQRELKISKNSPFKAICIPVPFIDTMSTPVKPRAAPNSFLTVYLSSLKKSGAMSTVRKPQIDVKILPSALFVLTRPIYIKPY